MIVCPADAAQLEAPLRQDLVGQPLDRVKPVLKKYHLHQDMEVPERSGRGSVLLAGRIVLPQSDVPMDLWTPRLVDAQIYIEDGIVKDLRVRCFRSPARGESRPADGVEHPGTGEKLTEPFGTKVHTPDISTPLPSPKP